MVSGLAPNGRLLQYLDLYGSAYTTHARNDGGFWYSTSQMSFWPIYLNPYMYMMYSTILEIIMCYVLLVTINRPTVVALFLPLLKVCHIPFSIRPLYVTNVFYYFTCSKVL